MLRTKLGAVPQINPRFGTNTLHNLCGRSLRIRCLTSLLKKPTSSKLCIILGANRARKIHS